MGFFRKVYLQPPFLVFIICFLVLGSTLVGRLNNMDGSQYALTLRLAEEQTVFLGETGEAVEYAWPDLAVGRDGRNASDREPGQAVLALPFYFLGKALEPILGLPYDGDRPNLTDQTKVQIITYTSLVFLVSIGLAYTLVLLKRLGCSTSAALITCLLIGLGTLMLTYSASFVRQPAVGILLLLVVLEVLLYRQERRQSDLILAVVFAGLAVTHDYMVVVPLAFLAVAVWILERPPGTVIAPALFITSVFAILTFAYNYATFGEILTSPHHHELVFVHIRDFSSNFQTPLHLGLPLNLFSFKPVPSAAVEWLSLRPELAEQ